MMVCTLCTVNVIKGTVYRLSGRKLAVGVVCEDCRHDVAMAKPEAVDEQMCECGKLEEWLCRARLDKENCPARQKVTLDGL